MDPATISALAGAAQGIVGGIGGVITYGSRKRELERQQARAQQIQKEQEEAAKKARGAIQDYQVGRGARQAYMMSQQDRAGDIAQREIQRAQGAGLGALQAGGARALIGGAGAMASQSARDAEAAAVRADQRRMQGQQTFATQEQMQLDKTRGMRNQLAFQDMAIAQARGLEAERDVQSMEDEKRLMKQQLASDAFSILGQATGDIGGAIAQSQMKDGAKIKETPGEFSHATNPIHLVRNGVKVGEATGGELIFNPEQSGKLETLATEGDTELHKYLRGLFKKFNKKS
jgi:hypothetical protein